MAKGRTAKAITYVLSCSCAYIQSLAWALLLFGYEEYNQLSELRKEQPFSFHGLLIIDGDTFKVSPQWKWNGQTSTRVRPEGYDAPDLHAFGGQAAKDKLSRPILGKQVDLRTTHKVAHGRLVCEVFFRKENVADHFPEYQ